MARHKEMIRGVYMSFWKAKEENGEFLQFREGFYGFAEFLEVGIES